MKEYNPIAKTCIQAGYSNPKQMIYATVAKSGLANLCVWFDHWSLAAICPYLTVICDFLGSQGTTSFGLYSTAAL